jgi:hypothetical protein
MLKKKTVSQTISPCRSPEYSNLIRIEGSKPPVSELNLIRLRESSLNRIKLNLSLEGNFPQEGLNLNF